MAHCNAAAATVENNAKMVVSLAVGVDHDQQVTGQLAFASGEPVEKLLCSHLESCHLK